MTGSTPIDAERAFARQVRARRTAAMRRRLGRGRRCDDRLPVYDEQALRRAGGRLGGGIREIPLDKIDGTLEPSRASLFDRCFRPSSGARARWQRVWIAEQRGAPLPPISVVPVGDRYVVRDGHHRVSVAKARGALTIDAAIDTPLAA